MIKISVYHVEARSGIPKLAQSRSSVVGCFYKESIGDDCVLLPKLNASIRLGSQAIHKSIMGLAQLTPPLLCLLRVYDKSFEPSKFSTQIDEIGVVKTSGMVEF
jgi:hypothetical protein